MGKHLTEHERYQIEILLKNKVSVQEIANQLGKHKTTIYREIKRGTVKQIDYELREFYVYKADYAQRDYDEKKHYKGADLKIGNNLSLVRKIEKLIKQHYSPYCISIFLKGYLSPTTIYRYVHEGLLLNVTNADLLYKKQAKKKQIEKRTIRNKMAMSIDQRPRSINSREDYGHWEIDTVYSGQDTSKETLLVCTERKSRFELVFKMPDRTKKSVNDILFAVADKIENVSNYIKTITCDNGGEFQGLLQFQKRHNVPVYYCHPYCSSERGSNENANKLVRYHIKKGEDISRYSDQEIREIQNFMNTLPRKLFGGMSSSDLLREECPQLYDVLCNL